jgi:hypothetical protein
VPAYVFVTICNLFRAAKSGLPVGRHGRSMWNKGNYMQCCVVVKSERVGTLGIPKSRYEVKGKVVPVVLTN